MDHDDELNFFGEPGKEVEILINDEGLADDVEQLRGMVHDLTCIMNVLLELPIVQLALPEDVYDNMMTMVVSAHAVVCPETAKALKELEEGHEIPVQKLTDQEKANADRILAQVFSQVFGGNEWQSTQEPEDSK